MKFVFSFFAYKPNSDNTRLNTTSTSAASTAGTGSSTGTNGTSSAGSIGSRCPRIACGIAPQLELMFLSCEGVQRTPCAESVQRTPPRAIRASCCATAKAGDGRRLVRTSVSAAPMTWSEDERAYSQRVVRQSSPHAGREDERVSSKARVHGALARVRGAALGSVQDLMLQVRSIPLCARFYSSPRGIATSKMWCSSRGTRSFHSQGVQSPLDGSFWSRSVSSGSRSKSEY